MRGLIRTVTTDLKDKIKERSVYLFREGSKLKEIACVLNSEFSLRYTAKSIRGVLKKRISHLPQKTRKKCRSAKKRIRLTTKINGNKLEQIINLSEKNKTIKEIFEQIHVNPRAILTIAKEKDLQLYKKFEELILKGESLFNIGDYLGVTREGARQIINKYDFKELRKDAKKEKKAEQDSVKNIHRQIAGNIELRIIKLMSADDWVYQNILRYKKMHQLSDADKVIQFLNRYKSAVDNKEEVSLNKLSEGIFHNTHALRILTDLNLPALCWRLVYKKLRCLRQSDLQAIELAKKFLTADNSFSAMDVAYFLYLPFSQRYISKTLSIKGRKRELTPEFSAHKELTYSLASRIYEAQDLNFSEKEIAELCDKSNKTVNFALTNRRTIEAEIINCLRHLHPDKTIEKPYMNNCIKKRPL